LNICIIDYGVGNTFSIKRAIEFCGFNAEITKNFTTIKSADRIILPGVGSFGSAMTKLRNLDLVQVIRDCINKDTPILGVCLGMQLLFTSSEEFGHSGGLDVISGVVERLPLPTPMGPQYKIPHVGWSKVVPIDDNRDLGLSKVEFMYFSHSFRVIPSSEEHVLAKTSYGGSEFCSAVKRENVYGVQFHPELSGRSGLEIYAEFLRV
jgi:imidazole glycerol-phosphate synthase subunit HisH